jgi:hypothetical protein
MTRPYLLILASIVFAGCESTATDSDDGAVGSFNNECDVSWYPDADGDGFGDDATTHPACTESAGLVHVAGDCDDDNQAVHPGAAELCNEIDDDCDGGVDINAVEGTTWYADTDADGLGSNTTYTGCTLPTEGNWVDAAGDCDDSDPSLTEPSTWWLDHDGDGYGDPDEEAEECLAPADHVANDDDCDDQDAALSPDTIWYADSDGDGYGDPGATFVGCERPQTSQWVANSDDCDDDNQTLSPDTIWYEDDDQDGYGDADTKTKSQCDSPGKKWSTTDGDCDDSSDSVHPQMWYLDGDGDGYGAAETWACEAPADHVSQDGDCDDSDPTTYPLATEYCDGHDDDCNGIVDDSADAGFAYLDVDGDGFGDPDTEDLVCDTIDGWVNNGDDCDDTDTDIHPGAEELCDNKDTDCDGEAKNDTLDGDIWYLDADGDGYGDQMEMFCETPPEAYVETGGDCDDDDITVYPDADEYCDDVDDDCDGIVDNEAVDATPHWADFDGDGYGDPDEPITACSGTQGLSFNDMDCNDNNGGIHIDADETCDGIDNNCDNDDNADAMDAQWWYIDADADGYGHEDDPSPVLACDAPTDDHVGNADDCDDLSNPTHPGAIESCNGVDDDCDSEVDVGATTDLVTLYYDGDEDGQGRSDISIEACLDLFGDYVDNDDDCDDEEEDTYRGAPEICDHIDNDCNDDTDVDEDAVDATVWWPDTDGDGWGDPDATESVSSCAAPPDHADNPLDCAEGDEETGGPVLYLDADGDDFGDPDTAMLFTLDDCGEPPQGWSEDGTDCDDKITEVNPDADEICDGVDHDCDGTADNDIANEDALPWHPDVDGDEFGNPDVTVWGCDAPDATWVLNDEDCDDQVIEVNPDATEVCDDDSVDENCDEAANDATADGAVQLWVDDDGDGYGNELQTETRCPIEGYVDNDDDCDDGDPASNPDAVWWVDSDLDGWGDKDDESAACLSPGEGYAAPTEKEDCNDGDHNVYPGAPELCVDGDEPEGLDNDCNGLVDDVCPEVHCGQVESHENWDANPYGHLVVCDVDVRGSGAPLLTIEDGAVVMFYRDTRLRVGESLPGSIKVQGAPTGQGVLFTSAEVSPHRGDWHGLQIFPDANEASLEGLTIEYAGGDGEVPGALHVQMDGTVFTDGAALDSGSDGIYIHEAYAIIQQSDIQNNDWDGVACSNRTMGCLSPWAAEFYGNVITGNVGAALRIRPSDAHALSDDGTYGPNGDNGVLLTPMFNVNESKVNEDLTLRDVGVPFRVIEHDIKVHGDNRPLLTLEAGVEMVFEDDTTLHAASTSLPGELVIAGTEEKPVILRGPGDGNTPGSWPGLSLLSHLNEDGLSSVQWLEHRGADALTYACPNNVDFYESTFATSNTGFVLEQLPNGQDVLTASIRASRFIDNVGSGLTDSPGSGRTGSELSAFEDNHFEGNGGIPLAIDVRTVTDLDDASTFTDNGEPFIELLAGTAGAYDTSTPITTDDTWPAAALPYLTNQTIRVASGGALTLLDGVEIRFASGTQLTVQGEFYAEGDLAAGEGVILTSSEATEPGSWGGIQFKTNGADIDKRVLNGTILEYAGERSSVSEGGIHIDYDSAATVRDSIIRDNRLWGIHNDGGRLKLTGTTVSGTQSSQPRPSFDNGDGVYNQHATYPYQGQVLAFADNTFTNNDRFPFTILGSNIAIPSGNTASDNGRPFAHVLGSDKVIEGGHVQNVVNNPWFIETSLYITGSSAPMLIFEPGSTLLMGEGTTLNTSDSWTSGYIVADDITFQGANHAVWGLTDAPGDWVGIDVDSQLIPLSSADPTQFTNCTFLHAERALSFHWNARGTVVDNTFEDNVVGIECDSTHYDGESDLEGDNTFIANIDYDVDGQCAP